MTEAGYRVRGRVQGVGYRWWTRTQAERLGLHGSVRNCEDGSVELHVRGPADAVSRLAALLKEGPPLAQVDAVEPIPFAGASDGTFQIVRPKP